VLKLGDLSPTSDIFRGLECRTVIIYI